MAKFKPSTLRQVSIASSIIGAVAIFVAQIAPIWGFEALGNQIYGTLISFVGLLSIAFGGATYQKNSADRKEFNDENSK